MAPYYSELHVLPVVFFSIFNIDNIDWDINSNKFQLMPFVYIRYHNYALFFRKLYWLTVAVIVFNS